MLTLDRVAKFYGSKLVFRDVSVRAEGGSVLIVAGPNGAGKTTLLRVMCGLARPDKGSVTCDVPEERLGYLGHDTFIYPEMTGLENLAFWAKIHGLRKSQAELTQALERMELAHAAHERAGRYSRGMAQRLNLARVFLPEPDLVFLDEPGTGLDIRSTGILKREIAAARDRGACLVWVSHHIAQDRELADSVLEIRDRGIGYSGPAADYRPDSGEWGCAC